MVCHEVQAKLQALLDGDLDPDMTDRLRRHVASCDRCRLGLESLQQVSQALGTWPLAPVRSDLTAEIMALVRRQPKPVPYQLSWDDVKLPLAVAASLFAIIVIWGYLPLAISAFRSGNWMAIEWMAFRNAVSLVFRRLGSYWAQDWKNLSAEQVAPAIALVITAILPFLAHHVATRWFELAQPNGKPSSGKPS